MATEWTEQARKYWDKRGRLNLWAGVLGHQALANHVEEQRRNSEAEAAHVRRAAWGAADNQQEGEAVGPTILGDVQTSPPVIITGGGGGSGILKTAAALLLGASVPSAFAAGWLLHQTPEAVETEADLSLGLGKIEDYLNPSAD